MVCAHWLDVDSFMLDGPGIASCYDYYFSVLGLDNMLSLLQYQLGIFILASASPLFSSRFPLSLAFLSYQCTYRPCTRAHT